jgi:hypothetical protein
VNVQYTFDLYFFKIFRTNICVNDSPFFQSYHGFLTEENCSRVSRAISQLLQEFAAGRGYFAVSLPSLSKVGYIPIQVHFDSQKHGDYFMSCLLLAQPP